MVLKDKTNESVDADLQSALATLRKIKAKRQPWALIRYRVNALTLSELVWEIVIAGTYHGVNRIISHRSACRVLKEMGRTYGEPDFTSPFGIIYDFGLYDAAMERNLTADDMY